MFDAGQIFRLAEAYSMQKNEKISAYYYKKN